MKAEFPVELPDAPIGACLAKWQHVIQGHPEDLSGIVAADAVLHSPVLYKPQVGRDLVVFYLMGAIMSFGGEGGTSEGGSTRQFPHPVEGEWDGNFRYIRAVFGSHDAILEFETVMAGAYVNGVDMIACDDDAMITDFKVMVRPARAVDAVKNKMLAALTRLERPT